MSVAPSAVLVAFMQLAANKIRDHHNVMANFVWAQRFALPVQLDARRFARLYEALRAVYTAIVNRGDSSNSSAAAAVATGSKRSASNGKQPRHANKRAQLSGPSSGELHKTYIQLGSDKHTQIWLAEESILLECWARLVEQMCSEESVRALEWPRAYQVALLILLIYLEDIDPRKQQSIDGHRKVFAPIKELVALLPASWNAVFSKGVRKHWYPAYIDFVRNWVIPPPPGYYGTLHSLVYANELGVMLVDFIYTVERVGGPLDEYRRDAPHHFARAEPRRWHLICDTIHSQRLLARSDRAHVDISVECGLLEQAMCSLVMMHCNGKKVRELETMRLYWSTLFGRSRPNAKETLAKYLTYDTGAKENKRAKYILNAANSFGNALGADFARTEPLREKLHLRVVRTLDARTEYPSSLCAELIAEGEWMVTARVLALVDHIRRGSAKIDDCDSLVCRWFPESAYVNLYQTVLLASQLLEGDFLMRVLVAPLRNRRCLLVMSTSAFALFNRVQHFEYVKAHTLHGGIRNRHADAYEMLYTLLHGTTGEFACGWVNTLHCLFSAQTMHSYEAALRRDEMPALITANYCERHNLGPYFRRFVSLLSHLFVDAGEQIAFMERACNTTHKFNRVMHKGAWIGLVAVPHWKENHCLHPYYGLCAFLAPHLPAYAPTGLMQQVRDRLLKEGLVAEHNDGFNVPHVNAQMMKPEDKQFYRHMYAWLDMKVSARADGRWSNMEPPTIVQQHGLTARGYPSTLPYDKFTGAGYRPDDPHRYRHAWYDLCQEDGFLKLELRRQMFFCLSYCREIRFPVRQRRNMRSPYTHPLEWVAETQRDPSFKRGSAAAAAAAATAAAAPVQHSLANMPTAAGTGIPEKMCSVDALRITQGKFYGASSDDGGNEDHMDLDGAGKNSDEQQQQQQQQVTNSLHKWYSSYSLPGLLVVRSPFFVQPRESRLWPIYNVSTLGLIAAMFCWSREGVEYAVNENGDPGEEEDDDDVVPQVAAAAAAAAPTMTTGERFTRFQLSTNRRTGAQVFYAKEVFHSLAEKLHRLPPRTDVPFAFHANDIHNNIVLMGYDAMLLFDVSLRGYEARHDSPLFMADPRALKYLSLSHRMERKMIAQTTRLGTNKPKDAEKKDFEITCSDALTALPPFDVQALFWQSLWSRQCALSCRLVNEFHLFDLVGPAGIERCRTFCNEWRDAIGELELERMTM